MTGNRRLFTLYKAFDGGHVIFGSNLKGKVIGGVIFTKVDCTISKISKMLANDHRRNGLYTCKLGDNSKQQIYLASMVDDSMLWHRRLHHANMWLVQNLASNELVRNLPKLSFKRHFCDTCGLGSQGNENNRTRNEVSTSRVLDLFGPPPNQSYGGNFYSLMIVDDHSNYTWVVFVESKDDVVEKFKILCKRLENLHDCSIVSISLPEPKSSPSVEDDRIIEPIVQNLVRYPSLEANATDPARRLSGLDYNNEALPYVRVMKTLFEYLKNKHPNDVSQMIEVEKVSPCAHLLPWNLLNSRMLHLKLNLACNLYYSMSHRRRWMSRRSSRSPTINSLTPLDVAAHEPVVGFIKNPDGHGNVKTFGGRVSTRDVFGSRSSLKNTPSSDAMERMVQAQVDAQLEIKVAERAADVVAEQDAQIEAKVAAHVSNYEKAQMKWINKLELLLGRELPPPLGQSSN
ncbi:retrovirus-related pol polyprotein from transposon TNT 1-94 [Tanacetum coccineum]|uniref:Retrovirus-related pol polyprotein from transposon TNT 1-94 n=1 Tax=Tanacetum coccineum TaxID=301880 RepID=A0ABQ5FPS6_9ASTR